MTANVLLISRALLDVPDRRRYGYELMRITRLRSSSMYVVLARMREAGWVTCYLEPGDPRELGRRLRVYYELTEKGEWAITTSLRHWVDALRGIPEAGEAA